MSEQETLFQTETRKKPFAERVRKSPFIRLFDKTPPGIICPHFYILAHANRCPYACDYCYLNLTFRHWPKPTVFSNTDKMLGEVEKFLKRSEPSVLNAGELSDALAWDRYTGLSRMLIPLFRKQSRHIILFLTKSTEITNLLKMEPTPQAVISFSINAPEVAKRFEHKSPPPLERLEAARRLKDAGWRVRIRIDPIIPIADWQKHYLEIADALNQLQPERVTLGTIRYFAALPNYAEGNRAVFKFATSKEGTDKRLRLTENDRIKIYSLLVSRLQTPQIALCKETEAVWEALPIVPCKCNCAI
jgi:spore photoproduct lyase